MTSTSKLLGLAATTALIAAGGALAQDVSGPPLQPEEKQAPSQSQPEPEAKPEAKPQGDAASAPPTSAKPAADPHVVKNVQDHVSSIVAGIDAAEAALTQLGELTSGQPADVGSVRRATDLAENAVHKANVGCDRLDDMSNLSGEAKTQVRDIERNLHAARDTVSKMGRESRVLRAPFTGGDAVRVHDMSSQARSMLEQARVGVDALAKVYDIPVPQSASAPSEKPAAEKPTMPDKEQ